MGGVVLVGRQIFRAGDLRIEHQVAVAAVHGGAVGLNVDKTRDLSLESVELLHDLDSQLLALLLGQFRLEIPGNNGDEP